MKSKTYPFAVLSALVAVVLFVAASFFEDDARWLPTERPDFDTRLPPPRADTAVRLNTDHLSCQQSENTLIERVGGARYCRSNDDCTLFDYGYPIQCLTSVSKNEITALRLAYRSYEQSCQYRVYYDCPSGPMERQPVCRSGRCEVQLVKDELLNEETLRHLGLEDL